MAGFWNWVIYKAPSNPNHSMIPGFYESMILFHVTFSKNMENSTLPNFKKGKIGFVMSLQKINHFKC